MFVRKYTLGHPFGNTNVRHALLALTEANLLASFHTTLCQEHIPFMKWLPLSLRTELGRRSFEGIDATQIISRMFPEAFRLLGSRTRRGLPGKRFLPTVDDLWNSLDHRVSKAIKKRQNESVGVYAYEDGAYFTFMQNPLAHKVYELPIGYWKVMHVLLAEERLLQPEWAPTLTGLSDSAIKLGRKDVELTLASQIIVPSEFVYNTLPMKWQHKTRIVHYGCPAVAQNLPIDARGRRRLKVLFCGSLGQRKGLSYFFAAIGRLQQHLDVTVIGNLVEKCPSLEQALKGVTWHPSLPRQRVLEIMRHSDVFLFPTLFEGRALVVLEALSQGLPVITTPNAGVSDVVIDGHSGRIVPIREVDALVEALQELIDSPDLLRSMKNGAVLAASRATWERYRSDLIQVLLEK